MREPSEYVQLSFRCRESLRARIECAAKANRTSLNSEMIARLEASFHHDVASETVEILRDIRELLISMRKHNLD